MKKIFAMIALLVFLLIPTSFAEHLDLRTEGQIGPTGIARQFYMPTYTQLFGNIIDIKDIQQFETHSYKTLVFDKANVYLRDNTVISLFIKNKYGDDGSVLKTPKGIFVGSDLKQMLNAYGIPTSIKKTKLPTQNWYFYSAGDGAGINFLIDSTINHVVKISIEGVWC